MNIGRSKSKNRSITEISVGYITMRKRPNLKWMLDGLIAQSKKLNVNIQLVVVDYWRGYRNSDEFELFDFNVPENITIDYVSPLPSLWQGEYQISKQSWYAAANARNTLFVYAKHNFIASCDDLTVLGEYWLQSVLDAMKNNYMALGAYRKDINMRVENGVLISSETEPNGFDSRWNICGDNQKKKVSGAYLYGCSWCMPLQTALKINGFDCLTDSIGYEDTIFASMLQRIENDFYYDKRMFTVESNDHPQNDFSVKRVDVMLGEELYFKILNSFGITNSIYDKDANKDCSHIIMEIANQYPLKASWNFFDLNELRLKIKNNIPITLDDMKYKNYTWFSNQLISDL